ncbi:hypothetical protein ACIQNG_26680 [Streptomyces sp. NPDC091377]|uniref:scabin-related ADP-ribosyltransferase n=1 Tax=Streptomyces sp. NPDC091377 TaxID=3365995 RepID=UPI00381458E3
MDSEPLFRFDGRTPDQIRAAGGFRPSSDRLPVSLQSYQNTTQHSAFVSFTRDPIPSGEMLDRTDSLSREYDPDRSPDAPIHRFNMSAPGGYDVTASLGTQSYPDQAEVVFYKGVRDQYIDSTTPFGFDPQGEPVQTGPTVPYTPSSTQEQPGYSQSHVASAANLGGPSMEPTAPRENRTSRESGSGAYLPHHGARSHGGQNRGRG